jgi:hypothetical protein
MSGINPGPISETTAKEKTGTLVLEEIGTLVLEEIGTLVQ